MDIPADDECIAPSTQVYHCYKVGSLTETILEATLVSNMKDRYVLGEQLGWGQFGVIRTCSDKLTGEVLACKSIAKERLVTRDEARSIKLEIEIMSRLSGHPNVVDLKAVYEDEDFVHLVMELCAGGELFHQLEKYGRFAEHEARGIFKHLMQVVKYCHDNGIVHRDLKPENILLAEKSSSSPIKLADFGLATYIDQGKNLHGTVGSPFYIAPEVLAGGYNQAADIWSTGVILYILLSGMPPFWGKTKSKIFDAVRAADLRFPPDPWNQISLSARDLITRMLCVDPSRRLNASEVLSHPWMEDSIQAPEETHKHDSFTCRQLEVGACSFSTPLMSRNQDFSFTAGSTAVTCQTSFSPLVDNSSPFPEGFSFSSCRQSSSLEFASPIPSMPSFSFFSPAEPANISLKIIKPNEESQVSNLEKLFAFSNSSLDIKLEARGGGAVASRISGMSSRRNHTIGLGELDQIDLIVTESVARWASCTRIPTAPSLRLSLVC